MSSGKSDCVLIELSSLDLFSGFVHKNVQASILLQADRRRSL